MKKNALMILLSFCLTPTAFAGFLNCKDNENTLRIHKIPNKAGPSSVVVAFDTPSSHSRFAGVINGPTGEYVLDPQGTGPAPLLSVSQIVHHGGRCGRCGTDDYTSTIAKFTYNQVEYYLICQ